MRALGSGARAGVEGGLGYIIEENKKRSSELMLVKCIVFVTTK